MTLIYIYQTSDDLGEHCKQQEVAMDLLLKAYGHAFELSTLFSPDRGSKGDIFGLERGNYLITDRPIRGWTPTKTKAYFPRGAMN